MATVAAAVAAFEEALAVLIGCVAALSADLLASDAALDAVRACRSDMVSPLGLVRVCLSPRASGGLPKPAVGAPTPYRQT